MLCVSFALTSGAYANKTKTETRRFWKPRHAEKFKPGTLFMGITKDFRAGGTPIHPSQVIFCRQERLADMTLDSFLREGGLTYWGSLDEYIQMMGGPEKIVSVLRFEHLE